MNAELTTDQKIELLKIASTSGLPLGMTNNTIETTVANFKRLLEAISTSPFPTIQ